MDASGGPLLGWLTRSAKSGVLRTDRHSIEDVLVPTENVANVSRPRYSIYFSSTNLCSNVENTKERQNSKGPWKPSYVANVEIQRNVENQKDRGNSDLY
jgi:hypothetical protein